MLFITYASTISNSHLTSLQTETAYVDDEVMGQRSQTPSLALTSLTTRLQEKIRRSEFVSVNFAPAKAEVMQLLPKTRKSKLNEEDWGVPLYGLNVALSTTIKLLGVTIDQRLSFRHHVANACARTRKIGAMIAGLGTRK